jgi:hypothetical protein
MSGRDFGNRSNQFSPQGRRRLILVITVALLVILSLFSIFGNLEVSSLSFDTKLAQPDDSDNHHGPVPLPTWMSSTKLGWSRFTSYAIDTATKWSLNQRTLQGTGKEDGKTCEMRFELIVSAPDTVPAVINCNPENDYWPTQMCIWLKRVFWHNNRTLFHNISFGYEYTDRHERDTACFGSSSPDGSLCFPNMEEILHISQNVLYGSYNKDVAKNEYEWDFLRQSSNSGINASSSSWWQRESIPIFRGTAWSEGHWRPDDECLRQSYQESLSNLNKRIVAVDFSKDHPDLLNAMFTRAIPDVARCFEEEHINRTGFAKLLPFDTFMDPKIYYTKYQTALVVSPYFSFK